MLDFITAETKLGAMNPSVKTGNSRTVEGDPLLSCRSPEDPGSKGSWEGLTWWGGMYERGQRMRQVDRVV